MPSSVTGAGPAQALNMLRGDVWDCTETDRQLAEQAVTALNMLPAFLLLLKKQQESTGCACKPLQKVHQDGP